MMMNNENKNLSPSRKRRFERKHKMSDDMKVLLIKIKSEKKKKNLDKIKHFEILLGKTKYADNPNKLNNALKELNKIEVVNKNLHEIKQEVLQDYNDEFEIVGNLKVGDQIRQTHIRFRNMVEFESYTNFIDEGYDADDCIFNGFFINSTLLNLIQ